MKERKNQCFTKESYLCSHLFHNGFIAKDWANRSLCGALLGLNNNCLERVSFLQKD